MSADRTFVGFGFGAIQGGLFLYEAHRTGRFGRLLVAEVMPDVLAAVRAAGGCYRVNVATAGGVEAHEVRGVEMCCPAHMSDRRKLVSALAGADEIATALPSVDFYDRGDCAPARLLAEAFRGRRKPGVVYAAENHNHAAELLDEAVRRHLPGGAPSVQFLNTVIGKMSGVVTDPAEIRAQGLAPLTPDLPRALLVEAFNRIRISRVALPGFHRGLDIFEEKADLLPFEEAKLYGHNAVHALLGYMAHERGLRFMSEVAGAPDLMAIGREAFLSESGGGLLHRHAGCDPLFSQEGFRAYAEDLLVRMMNPNLRDAVARVIRDPRRKLGWNDRLIGTIRLACQAGIRPVRFIAGAALAARRLAGEIRGVSPAAALDSLWAAEGIEVGDRQSLISVIEKAFDETAK
jgi:mannitol-1-phosphate 5-dehydrogenase